MANVSNYKEPGGDSWVVNGTITIGATGTLALEPGATFTGGTASNTIANGETLAIESGGAINVETGGLLKFNGTDKAAILAASVANQIAGTAASKKVHGAAATVSAGEDTAGTKTIATGVTIASAIVQIVRSGAVVTGDAAVSYSAANLVVADGATYVLTENDVINYIVFGT